MCKQYFIMYYCCNQRKTENRFKKMNRTGESFQISLININVPINK